MNPFEEKNHNNYIGLKIIKKEINLNCFEIQTKYYIIYKTKTGSKIIFLKEIVE